MNDIQNVLYNMMKTIHRICVEHDICYYMIGGTMLGSVRHKGFIPWDDDIDIGMPREDFNKFLNLAIKALPEWMELEVPGERSGEYNFGFAKIADANTTLVEKYDTMERTWGIFIDIFPLDGLGNNKAKSILRFMVARYRFLLLKLNQNLTHQGKNIADCVLRNGLRIYAKALGEKKLYRNLVRYAGKNSFYKSNYVANLVGSASMKEFMELKYFGRPKKYKFESDEFFGVEDADSYLSNLYGNYKVLPPEEKRVPHHGITFMTDMPYRDYMKRQSHEQ